MSDEKSPQSKNKLLSLIFSNLAKSIKPKMISWTKSLDDVLFSLSKKPDITEALKDLDEIEDSHEIEKIKQVSIAKNNIRKNRIKQIKSIQQSKAEIIKEFFNLISLTFKYFNKGTYDYTKIYDGSSQLLTLSLLEDSSLDESLAVTNMANKYEQKYSKNLHALQKRFSVLTKDSILKLNQIPICPEVLAKSFKKSIELVEIDTNLKLKMFKLFEDSCISKLDEVYDQINEIFIKKNILPQIDYNFRRNRQEQHQKIIDKEQKAFEDEQSIENKFFIDDPANFGDDKNYEVISQFYSNNQNENKENSTNSGVIGNSQNIAASTGIDLSSVLNAINSLQNQISNTSFDKSIDKSPMEIKDDIIEQLRNLDDGSETSQTVKKNDEDTIDLVGMLFQFIVDDRHLPDAIQVILANLQMPYLKIALQDRTIFSDKAHPARRLLDNLSIAAIGWTETEDPNKRLVQKIKDTASSIQEILEYDTEYFKILLSEFNKFLIKQNKKAEIIQKRTRERTLGKDKLNRARKEAAKILIGRMTNQAMPILIRDILLKQWPKVLVLMRLKHDKDSIRYTEKIDFVDTLIKYSKANSNIEENKIEELTVLYERSLRMTIADPDEIPNSVLKLKNCLLAILNPKKEEIQEENKPIKPEAVLDLEEIRQEENEFIEYLEEIIEPPKINTEKILDIEDEYIEKVKKLKKGSWIEFKDSEDNLSRAKLSWISPITEKFLFVNSRGAKSFDKTLEELALDFKYKSINIIHQVPIFDRAMSEIANKIKKKPSN